MSSALIETRYDREMTFIRDAYFESKGDGRLLTNYFNVAKKKLTDHLLAVHHCQRVFGSYWSKDNWIQKNLAARSQTVKYEEIVEKALKQCRSDHRNPADADLAQVTILEEAFAETSIPEYIVEAGHLLFYNNMIETAFLAYHTAFKRRPDSSVGVCVWTCLYTLRQEKMADWLLCYGPDLAPTTWMASPERQFLALSSFAVEPPIQMPKIWYDLAGRMNRTSANLAPVSSSSSSSSYDPSRPTHEPHGPDSSYSSYSPTVSREDGEILADR